MAITPFNIFKNTSATNLKRIESGVYKNEIPGLGVVETYGHTIGWRHVEVLKDDSIITEKRDRFEKRNSLVNAIAEVGSFEYALAVAPSVNGKRIAQCSFCNAHHNWVVFYRSTDGRYLGWSGTDCFGEVCRNLRLPAAEAMIEQVKAERTRCEKFRKTMEKVNDFKRDFPGLYENREALGGRQNPYCTFWWAVRNRLNDAAGVDEKWLQSCLDGAYDTTSRRWENGGYVVRSNQQARRIPAFLKWVSNKLSEGTPISEVIRLLNVKHEEELKEADQRARAAMAQPTKQPVAPVPVNIQNPATMTIGGKTQEEMAKPQVSDDDIRTKARRLLDSGAYNWSNVVKDAVANKPLSAAAVRFIEANFANLEAQSKKLVVPA